MIRSIRHFFIAISLFILVIPSFAQIDEVREVTGLPIPIGSPVIYGQVAITNFPRDERKPTIFVALVISGSQIERRQTNSNGYFYFLRAPGVGSTLVFEINGSEVGRAFLTPAGSNQVRQDISLDWRSLQGASSSKTGVLSAKDRYERQPENEKLFDRGMEAIRASKNADAIVLFKQLVTADPKDYFAWTMLGTIYFSEKKNDEAVEAFTSALEQKPDFSLALINWGKLEVGRKDYDKAIGLLSKAVVSDPTSPDANHVLGECYLQAKKGSLAVGYLNKAIELAPIEKAEIHLRLATLYNGAGLKDRAAAEYKMFLEKVKDHPDRKKFEQYVKENGVKS